MKETQTVPNGFLFSTVEAAIKKPGRKDLALILADRSAVVAGVFTTNKVKAAPVRLCMKRVRSGKGRGIVVNSGNANACTGRQGAEDALEMAERPSSLLGLRPEEMLVCSTGVIGTPLPMQRIRPALDALVGGIGSSAIQDVAAAIMTTDTFPKIVAGKAKIGKGEVVITGICKGAGMIAPRMATMLGFIMTDAAIERKALSAALKHAVRASFNRITIDGDMSTNDTVLIMANGAAGNPLITAGTKAYRSFSDALFEVTYDLARLVVKDGEGATKTVEIDIRNAATDGQAEKGAFAVANSLLVKTAIYGNDANWGRIMSALGYSGISLDQDKVDITLNGVMIARRGLGTGRDSEANAALNREEVSVVIDLHLGKGKAKVLTCDLTESYIKINAEYRT